jgi:hypothetical protein
VELERSILIGSYHPTPYVSAEVFYESQYQKWNTTALYAGCLFPIGKHYQFDSYYEHQNITNTRPMSSSISSASSSTFTTNPNTRTTEQGEPGYVLVEQIRYVDRSRCGAERKSVNWSTAIAGLGQPNTVTFANRPQWQ